MWRGQRIEMGFQEKVKSVIHSFVMQTLLYENYMCHLKKKKKKTCTYLYLHVFICISFQSGWFLFMYIFKS